ncbi:MAG TPA: alkaline phosphatase family protein [Acidimicrobiia bacterium]
MRRYTRRSVLQAAGAAGVVLATGKLPRLGASSGVGVGVGVRPNPQLPEGVDTIPEIEHVVVLMMENHSYDNYLGVLGRGDGLKVDRRGRPLATNLDAHGQPVRAFRMPSTCQLRGSPDNSWTPTHVSMNGRRNDGFAKSSSGPVAMGYWTPEDLPFYAGLARTFVLADRWFASIPAKTYPNRYCLLSGTANGLITNTLPPHEPTNGSIMEVFDAHGISWLDYYASTPTTDLFPNVLSADKAKQVPIAQFFTDAAAGSLPFFSLVEPDYGKSSEEDPQDIRVGEQFASKVINAAMHGPGWSKTLLVWCYDESGGYYDHVPPPTAPVPDAVPPNLAPSDVPGGYDRYGFRVPAVVVSPRAKRGHVSSIVYDHTSILRLVETKWNLPALTNRDGHAANLLDCVDLHGTPAFLTPPRLPQPSLATSTAPCVPISASSIPS